MCPFCSPLGYERDVCANGILCLHWGCLYPDDDIVNSPTHPHPTHPHQCEALPTDDSAPPSLSPEAHPFPLPPSPGASEESPSSASCQQLEEVEGEQQDADLLSDYTVLSITPSVAGSGDGRSHDSHVTGGEEAQ